MPKKNVDLLQGTLDMLILQTLMISPMHGYAIVRRIQQVTEGVLKVEEGSLYPALHRMERRGWISASWGLSENNRKAKYYQLTPSGRRHLKKQISTWEQLSTAIAKVLQPAPKTA